MLKSLVECVGRLFSIKKTAGSVPVHDITRCFFKTPPVHIGTLVTSFCVSKLSNCVLCAIVFLKMIGDFPGKKLFSYSITPLTRLTPATTRALLTAVYMLWDGSIGRRQRHDCSLFDMHCLLVCAYSPSTLYFTRQEMALLTPGTRHIGTLSERQSHI